MLSFYQVARPVTLTPRSVVLQGQLVELVLSKTRTVSVQVGDVITKFLDCLHLLIEELLLQEVSQVRVVSVRGQLVQVKQTVVDLALQLECSLEGLNSSCVIELSWCLDRLQLDGAASIVQVFHQLLSMLALLVRVLQEELVESVEGDVMTIELVGEGQVDVAGVQLHVDLVVDGSLAVLVKILTNERHYVASIKLLLITSNLSEQKVAQLLSKQVLSCCIVKNLESVAR